MKKTLLVGLGVALSFGTALAQPAPPPTPPPTSEPGPSAEPAPESPPASQPAKTAVTQEKAANENLQENATTAGQRPWAAGVSQAQQQQAMELFREGNTYHNDGLFPKAVELYHKALKSWNHPAIHYNLALSLMNLDRPIEVEKSLQAAIKYGPAPLSKDKYDHAKSYLRLIQNQLATVDISCSKPGAKVSVDGKEVFTVGPKGQRHSFKSRVRIGKHTFVAEKPGYNAEIEAPFIGPGETFRIELKLYTAEELTRYRRRWNARWFPYAVIGGGVAIGLIGGGLELWAKSSFNDFDNAVAKCATESGMSACARSSSLDSMRTSGNTKRTLGYIAYGTAAAAVVTGAVLVVLNRRTSYQITADEYRRELREKQKKNNTHTSITPVIAPGIAGAMVRGSF